MAIMELDKLLKGMEPKAYEERFLFASVGGANLLGLANYLDSIECIYKEEEGLTVLFTEDIKDEVSELSLVKVEGPFTKITLTVNSDLMAVGFLAKITEALAKEGISVNAFSAYHHDHLFVPYGSKDKTMEVLKGLTKV